MEQHNDLGAFVRHLRERLTPQQLGLPEGSRRRAKGLRREEVAALAGISPTWLTWIEQGRTRSVSAATLARLADTLRLSRAERDYLFDLAALKDPQEAAPTANPEAQQALALAVARIASPAYVLDGLWQVPAWNASASTLFAGWLDDADSEKNLLDFMFLQPVAQTLVADWATRARRMVAEFRAENSARHDEALATLLSRLQRGSAEFAALWQQQDVQGREGGERAFHHPQRGRQSYQQLTLRLAHAPGLKLVMLL